MFSFEVVRNIRKPSGKCFSRALIGYSNLGYPVLLGSPSDPKLATDKWLPGLQQAAVYKINCEEISQINEEAVPDNTKKATKLGLAVFHYR